MEVTPREAAVVVEALTFMSHFEQRSTASLPESCGFRFRPNPSVSPSEGELPPRVHAVVEVVGLTFSQGVNEMQTLANLSSSRDVLKQVEINLCALTRIKDYYRLYRDALDYQLVRFTPDMVDALAGAQPQPPIGSPGMPRPTSPGRQSLSPNPAASVSASMAGPSTLKRRKSFLRPSVVASSNGQNDALTAAVSILKTKVLQYNDRLLDQLVEAVTASQQTPHEKHVDVLLKSSALCRQMAGNISILCKSGKRTPTAPLCC